MTFLRLPLSLALSFMLFMSTVIPSNVQAASIEELDNIFDRFHYSLSVEWDQKDAEFKALAEKELSEALDISGVTVEELTEYIATKILSGSAGIEFKKLLSAMKEQGLSPKTAAALAAQFLQGAYAQGTHFMGEGAVHGSRWSVVVVALVVVVVAHWLIKKSKNHHSHDDGDTIIIIVK